MDQVMPSIQPLYPLAKNTKIMLGVVWPDNHVAFPDFLDSTGATANWWISEFNTFHQQVAILFSPPRDCCRLALMESGST